MINIAIMGAGYIAGKMAQTLSGMKAKGNKTFGTYAVASREESRAQTFAKEHGFAKAYGSYEAMLNDPNVHLVYIATPHSHHYEQMKMCIAHGKHVLCEKAFTVNAPQAEEVIALAREKGLYMAEAVWTRYQPSRTFMLEIIDRGVIGTPKMVTANLAVPNWEKPRIRKMELAGGALLDLGIYAITFASMVLGSKVASIHTTAQMMDTGVDMQESITLIYESGEMAVLCSAVTCAGDNRGVVYGTKGTLAIDNVTNPQVITVTLHAAPEKERTYPVPPQITGYEYEVEAAIDAIGKGRLEPEAMPHAETIRIMRVMDELRAQWGLKYPFE
jgi:predicted dehydrogenase